MKAIKVIAETESGKYHVLEVNGKFQATAIIKFRQKFPGYIKKLDEVDKTDPIIDKHITFVGSWGYAVLKPLIAILDKNNIKWWLDP